MKRIGWLILAVGLLIVPALARAQQPTFAQTSTNCATAARYGTAAYCIDPSGTYIWNGTGAAFEPLATQGMGSAFGALGDYTTSTPVLWMTTASGAGHFNNLYCTVETLNGGSCSTAPTVNVFDASTSNTGTALTCSATAQSVGTISSQAQTLTWKAGDVIGIYISTVGGTCVAPLFAVSAN